jgi:hypothetical protein
MKRYLPVLIVVALLFPQLNCLAWDGANDLSKTVDNSAAVLIGEVSEIKKPNSSDPSAQLADRLYRVNFKVEYSWKGAGF